MPACPEHPMLSSRVRLSKWRRLTNYSLGPIFTTCHINTFFKSYIPYRILGTGTRQGYLDTRPIDLYQFAPCSPCTVLQAVAREAASQNTSTAIHNLRGKLRLLLQEHQSNVFIFMLSTLTQIFVISAHILENTTEFTLQGQL